MDPPLSDEGRRQAALLATRLAHGQFQGLYSSDLQRAFQTAHVLGEALGLHPEVRKRLREVFLGEWEGLNTDEIAKRFPEAWASWVEEPDWDVVPGGEGAAAFDARVGAELDEILRVHAHGEVLIVTHGGVIQVALHRLLGRPSSGLWPFRIQNASISLIEKREGRMVIGGVNDVAHLDAVVPA
jgi:broad specificity phosphatase PhoE